jgi:tRNA G46 methylase TrmB
MNLPKLEAVYRTDRFFEDFADNEIFNQIIKKKQFPQIFRKRWNEIYRFFHEGTPSTRLNDTIGAARSTYAGVNLEINMRNGELLQSMAKDNWAEYFIGIGKDQTEVSKTKSRLAKLDPHNASAFWGDAEKLIPLIDDRPIDNFLMVLPEDMVPLSTGEDRESFRAMLAEFPKKLVHGGKFRILTDMEQDGAVFRELVTVVGEAGLQQVENHGKSYFPKDWRDPEFKFGRKPRVAVFALK